MKLISYISIQDCANIWNALIDVLQQLSPLFFTPAAFPTKVFLTYSSKYLIFYGYVFQYPVRNVLQFMI